jgi:hypothetical protein
MRRYARTLDLIKDLFPNIRQTRWKNRTDFYSLFVVFSEILADHDLPQSQNSAIKKTLAKFADEVEERIGNEHATVSRRAAEYARAAVRGSSDRSRRVARHDALRSEIEHYFKPASKNTK